MPILFYVIQLVIQITYLTEDTVKFLLVNGRIEECERAINKVYKTDSGEFTAKDIMIEKQQTQQNETSKCTVREAYLTRYYRTGSFVAMVVMIIH